MDLFHLQCLHEALRLRITIPIGRRARRTDQTEFFRRVRDNALAYWRAGDSIRVMDASAGAGCLVK